MERTGEVLQGRSGGHIIALVNQKGGCGKTTTAVNLGACLAALDFRVLLVDLDPQANATVSLGLEPGELPHTIYHVITESRSDEGGISLEDILRPSTVPGLVVAPSSIDLAAAELELVARIGREHVLRRKLESLRDRYDFVVIDTPPSLGLLTLNALVAADQVVIPIQTHYYALLGMRQLLRTLQMVRDEIGHRVEILGVLATMYDGRNNLSREILRGIQEFFGEKVFQTTIHFSIKLVESSMAGVPIFLHLPQSRGAQEYMSLAKEVVAREQIAGGTPARDSGPYSGHEPEAARAGSTHPPGADE
ncbi:MAG: ParA family protein [Armatimonadota bacterium]|nr:ParA family protein [Armatimonadota bacterium]MDR7438422.1 ParA family protein [Armatimonadota bacterium]MDR7562221.1 ParA family protein [Armatimonadota bacterium]MDR7567752.1 ParA family protein [Armatimonadota bacterium]MDR7601266.1 ParA family protein [Armatimonadota bacterium]